MIPAAYAILPRPTALSPEPAAPLSASTDESGRRSQNLPSGARLALPRCLLLYIVFCPRKIKAAFPNNIRNAQVPFHVGSAVQLL